MSTPARGQKYTVQAGDFLSKIAQEPYGDGSDATVQKIYQANKDTIGPDPGHITPGMVLNIPS